MQDTLIEKWINIHRISCTNSLLETFPTFWTKKKQCKDLLFESTSSNFFKHDDADYWPIQAIWFEQHLISQINKLAM
jgi:hypothetical protein